MNTAKQPQPFRKPRGIILRLIRAIPPLPKQATRWCAGLGVMLLLTIPARQVAAAETVQTNAPIPVHFAFSKAMLKDINENDAKAAMKVYAKTIGDENNIDTSAGPIYLDGTNAIAEALRLKQIDMISLTAEEFLALENQGLEGPLLMAIVNQTFTEEYVLLARTNSPIRKVEDLPGHSLIISSDLRAALAPLWLEVLCREHGLGPANKAFAKITFALKTTQVVLPVFFGKADVCIITRNGWDVMGELNPQVKITLRAVAMSQPVVPVMDCFRRGVSETVKQRIIKAEENSGDKLSFKELMALFKTDKMGSQPLSALDSTRQLVAQYHRLCAGTNQAAAPKSDLSHNVIEGTKK
jgi:ABC-type phosphate/phosphonate transport system substrate-binding protein